MTSVLSLEYQNGSALAMRSVRLIGVATTGSTAGGAVQDWLWFGE